MGFVRELEGVASEIKAFPRAAGWPDAPCTASGHWPTTRLDRILSSHESRLRSGAIALRGTIVLAVEGIATSIGAGTEHHRGRSTMKTSIGRVVVAASLAFVCAPASAADHVVTTAKKAAIEIMPNESEVDRTLEAICLGAGRIELRIGAELQVGKGAFDPVSVKVVAGKTTATLTGVSVKSPNFEMTGGSELLTVVEANDGALALLSKGRGDVTLAAGEKRMSATFDAAAKRKLAAFVDACRSSD
jgi:hypothetical protein